jgi:predicted esterase
MTSKSIRITLLAAVALFCSICGCKAAVEPNSVTGAKANQAAGSKLTPTDGNETIIKAVESALARPELKDYRGWLKFLRYEAETAVARHGADSNEVREKTARLKDWTQRIDADPQLLGKLRGVQEWAYESPVDGTGQPFKVMIPTDYDSARPAPLFVTMHGYTGDHLNQSTSMRAHTGSFEVAVLGRSRGGGYLALSQADVLQVIDYIEAHWQIDPNRIHINGGSMGGGGTLTLGARFPHRFASGQVTCGYIAQNQINNLLTFPIYATHSSDDPVVPPLLARGPLADLRRRGGQAIFDETNGFGHAVWGYAAGNKRSGEWAEQQVRPDSHTVRHLDFTALDGAAMRCWWAEIAEWGAETRPAHFVATAGENNLLFVELDNVARLRLRVTESPFDSKRPLRVSVNGAVPREIAAPLPSEIVVDEPNAVGGEAPVRLHTPGGPIQAYDGSPLLIVYGTGGDAATNTALRAAAEAASKSPNTTWMDDSGEADPNDKVPHRQNLFGRLATRPDSAVTEADITRCNLVLIGTASENAVVARIAERLPVHLMGNEITCSDGLALPASHRTVGLLYFNPLAPQRLVFWVASTEAAGYRAKATVPALASPLFIGADLLVTHSTEQQLVATRSFDSRWRWNTGREKSPILSAQDESQAAIVRRIAEAVRRATGADFAVAGRIPNLGEAPVTPGVTRVADITPLFYGHRIDLLEMSGADLLEAQNRLAKKMPENSRNNRVSLEPQVTASMIEPTRTYRVAVPMSLASDFGRQSGMSPRLQRQSETMEAEALTRYLTKP